jgi:hypothetical protein
MHSLHKHDFADSWGVEWEPIYARLLHSMLVITSISTCSFFILGLLMSKWFISSGMMGFFTNVIS